VAALLVADGRRAADATRAGGVLAVVVAAALAAPVAAARRIHRTEKRGAGRSATPRMSITTDAEKWITENLGPITGQRGMGGGSGWASLTRYSVEGLRCDVVVKASSSKPLERMFLGEALGLRALRDSGHLAIPEVFAFNDGSAGGSYVIMEFLPFSGRADPELFGRCMAQMHAAEPLAPEAKDGKFGFAVDNTIGDTPQPNGWTAGSGTAAWVEFFREKRIGHQVRLARDDRLRKTWDRVLEKTDGLATLFEGVDVKPSVLHGDLWSGNIAAVDGEPAIFDPAVYYGHHEAEWGMSWCASLTPAFWKGYREVIAKDEGFAKRAILYELYHKLNHYNLFGGGYYNDASSLMTSLAD
jgi:fructosamine-3-kinase